MPQSSRTMVTSRACAAQRDLSCPVAPKRADVMNAAAAPSLKAGPIFLKGTLLLILLGFLIGTRKTDYTDRRWRRHARAQSHAHTKQTRLLLESLRRCPRGSFRL